MSLRYKVLLILTVVVLVYAAGDHAIQRVLVSRSFEELEREEAQRDLQRVEAAIAGELEELGSRCRRLAVWQETQRFTDERDQRAIQSCLEVAGMDAGELDLFFLCDATGRVLWSRILEPGTRTELQLPEAFPRERLNQLGHPMLRLEQALAAPGTFARTGLLETEQGLMLASSHAIPGGAAGGTRGTLILGRFLGAELVGALGARTKVRFELFPLLQDQLLPERTRELRDLITAADQPIADVGSDGELHVYRTLNDVSDQPVYIVRANIERSITERGYRAVWSALLSSIATALLILLVLLRVLQQTVVRPISQLTSHAVAIRRTDDTSARIAMQRNDEIGVLSNEFDRMMDELAESRAKLVDTARLAGMSDVATGVLHNVGNVLNSVNVSASLVTSEAGELAVEDLEQVVGVLEQHADDLGKFVTEDPRGRHFLPFLREVRDALVRQKRTLRQELHALGDGVTHVIELVRSQQSLAGRTGMSERVSLSKQIDAAIHITTQSFAPTAEVEIVREYAALAEIVVDRQKLLEILVNLTQNARQALESSPNEPRRLTFRTRASGGRVHIEVEDNGVGIAAEDLARIFGHGFTTKQDGHGFGLHISANAATEMGGQLSVRSAGRGQGATFVLDLPLVTAARAVAA